MHVGDGGASDPAQVAVDAAHEHVDLVTEDAVLLDPLPRRRGHLHEDRVLDVDLAVAHQLAERAQPRVDALGVVEPVDTQEDPPRVAQRLADLRRATGHRLGPGELLEPGGVDGDREGGRLHRPAVGEVDRVAVGLVPDPAADEPHEVGGRPGELEADEVRPEQALQDLAPPGQLGEQLGGREGDVEVEADAQVRSQVAQHLRHQLELVVLDPDRRALGRDLGGPVGEALVDGDVGVPPLAVELRLGHHVVVERPQRAVGEALVELGHLLGAHRHRDE